MDSLMKILIFQSIIIVVYNKPTATDYSNDIRQETSCYTPDLSNITIRFKMCGIKLTEILDKLCAIHHNTNDIDGTGNKPGVSELCCQNYCYLREMVIFCKCVNMTTLSSIIERYSPPSTTTTTIPPTNMFHNINSIRKDKSNEIKDSRSRRKPLGYADIDDKPENYSHRNNNVNLLYY